MSDKDQSSWLVQVHQRSIVGREVLVQTVVGSSFVHEGRYAEEQDKAFDSLVQTEVDTVAVVVTGLGLHLKVAFEIDSNHWALPLHWIRILVMVGYSLLVVAVEGVVMDLEGQYTVSSLFESFREVNCWEE